MRKARAEGFGILRTEAFCCLTKEFWVIFAFSYNEVDGDVEVVDLLIAIFSLAVADSESKCRFCKSSAMGESSSCFLIPLFIVLELAVLEVVVVVIFCLILFKAISSELPSEVIMWLFVVGLAVVSGFIGCISVTQFVGSFDDVKSSISWPDSLEGSLNCLRLLLGFSVANPFVVTTDDFVVVAVVDASVAATVAAFVVEIVFSIFISGKFVGLA